MPDIEERTRSKVYFKNRELANNDGISFDMAISKFSKVRIALEVVDVDSLTEIHRLRITFAFLIKDDSQFILSTQAFTVGKYTRILRKTFKVEGPILLCEIRPQSPDSFEGNTIEYVALWATA